MDLERNDVVGASAWVERALQLDDGNPAAHYLDARVRSKSGANAAALQAIERALAIEERFFLAHVEAGAIQRQLGNDEEALRHWKRALELGAPEEWEAGLKQVATDQVKKQIAAIEARAGRTVDEGAEESP
jgi:tetratricopeptide (TPR) repeat protein